MPDTPGKRQRREVQARRRMEKSAKRVARRAQRLDPNAYQELRPSDEGAYRWEEDNGDTARPDQERSPHADAEEPSSNPDEPTTEPGADPRTRPPGENS